MTWVVSTIFNEDGIIVDVPVTITSTIIDGTTTSGARGWGDTGKFKLETVVEEDCGIPEDYSGAF